MRFILGPIPDEFTPDGAWRPIREPGPIMMQFFALPLGLVIALVVGYGWHRVGMPASLQFDVRYSGVFALAMLLSFPALIVVHELLHAAVHPGWGLSHATIIGAWPRRLLFYAHYSGPLSRNRFLCVLAMPLLVITVLPLVMAACGLKPATSITWAVAWVSTLNALAACGDCFGLILISFQVPAAAIVQNQSWRTYWKPV
jgi:hypothetical protein